MTDMRSLDRDDHYSRFRYKLMAPYLLVAALVGVVGYQLLSYSQAEPLPASGLVLTVEKFQYKPGETVRFTLRSNLDQTVYITNNCPDQPLEVYRNENGQWQQLHSATDAAKCQGEPRSYPVAPHAEVSATYRYWPDLFTQPGHYRLQAPIEQYQDKPTVEFDVLQ